MDFSPFLDSRLRGNDTLLDCRLRGNDTLGLASRGEASCYIRLKCYVVFYFWVISYTAIFSCFATFAGRRRMLPFGGKGIPMKSIWEREKRGQCPYFLSKPPR